VFSQRVWVAQDRPVAVPVIGGGYAAIEAEFAIKLSGNIPVSVIAAEPRELQP
jgi:hypothetical protein